MKVGRLINSIAFAAQVLDDYIEGKSPVHQRQFIRASLQIGGYLYEGLLLLDSLRAKYWKEESFNGLLELIGPQYEMKRKILYVVRHKTAFHLDSDDKWTEGAIKSLPSSRINLASGESDRMLDFYFNLADDIDNFFLGQEYKRIMKSEVTDDEAVRSVYAIIAEMYPIFLRTAHTFLIGVSERLQISEFTE